MFKISPFSGKRFKAFFEKISFLSNTTSNTPPPDDIKEISIGHALISESLIYGIENTIQNYIKLIQ